MWTVQCTLYTVSTFLSSASSSSSVHDEILFYLERIKFLFISINIRISFIFLFPIQCYHEYGNIWSQDCFLHVWETLKYDCSFLSIKCSSCIHSKESFMSATIRMGKITLRLLKKPFAMEWEKERWLCTNMTFLACFCYYLRWKIL